MRLLTSLLLMLCLTGAFAQTDSLKRERKVTFGLSVTPVFYYDVKMQQGDTKWAREQAATGTAALGMHVLLGPMVKKRFHPSLGIGLEGWTSKFRMPVYFDFGMRMLRTRISPYYHLSLGYMFMQTGSIGNRPETMHAFLFGAGFGISIYAVKKFSVGLCADYRLLNFKTYYNRYSPGGSGYLLSEKNYIHQAGLRLLLTCY